MENPVVLRPNEYSIPVTMEVDVPVAPSEQEDVRLPVDVAGFDDDLGGRSSPHRSGVDIRSHLDDLARRHPDLADQLRGFPGGGEPNYSGETNNTNGAEAKPEQQEAPQQQQQQSDCKIGNLQNHGLRNTVPLVDPAPKSCHPPPPMSQDSGARSPRAQSAPPMSSEEPQRFVSKIEIQPNHNAANSTNQETSEMYIPTGDENQAPAPHPTGQPPHSNLNNNQPQHTQPEPAKAPHVKQPNVRHIPIFVEGRDAPIVNRDHETSQPPPPFHEAPSYHPPPGYHEPHQRYREPIFEPMYSNNTPVDRPFGGVHHSGGGVGFDIPIQTERGGYRNPNQFGGSGFSKPSAQQKPPPQEKVHRVFAHNQQAEPPHPSHGPSHPRSQQQQKQQKPTSKPSSHAGAPNDVPDAPAPATTGPSPPPKKMSRPKTPLEIINEVQAEVDKLKAEIDKYNGFSRSEKEYIYLDEMLTRELLKLDNVDSGGVEDIRNLRRTTIKNIQATIAALEAKVPSTPGGAAKEEVPESSEAVETPSEKPMEGDASKTEGEAKVEGENKGGVSQSDASKEEKNQSEASAQPNAQGDHK